VATVLSVSLLPPLSPSGHIPERIWISILSGCCLTDVGRVRFGIGAEVGFRLAVSTGCNVGFIHGNFVLSGSSSRGEWRDLKMGLGLRRGHICVMMPGLDFSPPQPFLIPKTL
jgi:hypothetical protein